MQIKNISKFHLTPMRTSPLQKFTNNICWHGHRGKGTLLHWLIKPLSYLSPGHIFKLNELANPMFMAAQFRIVNIWKPTSCLSIHELIKRLWYIESITTQPHTNPCTFNTPVVNYEWTKNILNHKLYSWTFCLEILSITGENHALWSKPVPKAKTAGVLSDVR